MNEKIVSRKIEHINVCVNENVEYEKKTTLLEKVELPYYTLPEISMNDIDMSVEFMGKKLNAPLFVEGMTGGCVEAIKINKEIANVCEKLGIGMGLGSQRAMLKNPELTKTYEIRDVAPNILLIGNIGVSQLKEYSIEQIQKIINNVNADGIAIHVNSAQEAVQTEGTPNFRECINGIERFSNELNKPVIIKEVGNGINGEIAEKLSKTNIYGIDVGGAGGTSWTKVEYLRRQERGPYEEIGISTAQSIIEVRSSFNGQIIGSGGIRTGLDVVKCISLGANLGGMALPVIRAQQKGINELETFLKKVIREIKIGMFLSGAKTIQEIPKLK